MFSDIIKRLTIEKITAEFEPKTLHIKNEAFIFRSFFRSEFNINLTLYSYTYLAKYFSDINIIRNKNQFYS